MDFKGQNTYSIVWNEFCVRPEIGGGLRLLGALLGGGCVYMVPAGGGPRLPSTLIEEKYRYNPCQMDSQVTK